MLQEPHDLRCGGADLQSSNPTKRGRNDCGIRRFEQIDDLTAIGLRQPLYADIECPPDRRLLDPVRCLYQWRDRSGREVAEESVDAIVHEPIGHPLEDFG